MGSEDFQDLAAPHPTTRILFIHIGCGPADVRENTKKGLLPATNPNPKLKAELPALAAGTRADALVLLEFLKKK